MIFFLSHIVSKHNDYFPYKVIHFSFGVHNIFGCIHLFFIMIIAFSVKFLFLFRQIELTESLISISFVAVN